MSAGFEPAAFWNETPRSFVTIMEGASRRIQRGLDYDVRLAWHMAAFSGAAQAGKLKKLDYYMNSEKQPQTPDQMLKTLMALKEMGAPMDIREVN